MSYDIDDGERDTDIGPRELHVGLKKLGSVSVGVKVAKL